MQFLHQTLVKYCYTAGRRKIHASNAGFKRAEPRPPSPRMEEQDRLWHLMAKIARRLGDRHPDPEIPPRRPKWMHSATYGRLLESWHDAAERRDEIYDTKIAGCIAQLIRLGG